MKGLRILTGLMCLVAIVSCSRMEAFDNTDNSYDKNARSFIVNYADSEEGTRTVLKKDGVIFWSPNDSINIFYGDTYLGKYISESTQDSRTAVFKEKVFLGTIESAEEMYYWATFPYNPDNYCTGNTVFMVIPPVQSSTEGTFIGFPAVARSKTNVLDFYNLCGGVQFSVTHSGITSVTFSGNNDEILAGMIEVDYHGESNIPYVVGNPQPLQKVTVISPDENGFQIGEKYSFSLLPTSLDEGFTITYKMASGSSASFVSNAKLKVKRATFGVLADNDKDLEFPQVAEDYVDLGLPSGTKWATCNLGASSPEEYGDYYAWGEVEPKEKYLSGNYLYSRIDTVFLKYNKNVHYGTVDNKIMLDQEDDAATVNLGSQWRMPTYSEYKELIDNCSWEYTTVDGVKGFKVTGTKSGYTTTSIFIPDCGYMSGSKVDKNSTRYWTSNALASKKENSHPLPNCFFAKTLRIKQDSCSITWITRRYYGCPVRAVTEVSNADESSVDLGLSVRWAKTNIGAAKETEKGDLFSWGETKPVSKTSYSLKYYALATIDTTMLKYCVTEKYHFNDGLTSLRKQDDAAYIKKGNSWRIPTNTQFKELVENCTWEKTKVNNVPGWRGTSKIKGYTERSIFFPLAGYKGEKSTKVAEVGQYWTSKLYNNSRSGQMYSFESDRSEPRSMGGYRHQGRSIRPVKIN